MAVLPAATAQSNTERLPSAPDGHSELSDTNDDPGVPPGWKIIDGDILVPIDFAEGPDATFDINFWPGGDVPFQWAANVTTGQQTAMLNAMALWEAVADVDFRPRSGEPDYVIIRDSTGDPTPRNSSAVGMQGGSQTINITSWNAPITMAHELGHCLGYFHEHQRPDRGAFVSINCANVTGGCAGTTFLSNFPIESTAATFGPYDFDSVMHYGQCAFSACANCPSSTACTSGGRTIDVLAPYTTQWQSTIGQRTHLSVLDRNVMRCLYPFANDRFLHGSYFGLELGTFIFPWNRPFMEAYLLTPSGGSLLVIGQGEYDAQGRYSEPRTIVAPIGGVILR